MQLGINVYRVQIKRKTWREVAKIVGASETNRKPDLLEICLQW